MKALYFWLLSFILLNITGCIDSPVDNGINSASGRVVDINGYPVHWCFVSSGIFDTTTSDVNGNYMLKETYPPYKLVISGANLYSHPTYSYIFCDINSLHCQISLLTHNDYYEQNIVTVYFPELGKNRFCNVFFICDRYYYLISSLYGIPGNTVKRLYLSLPPGISSLSGKLLYLETTRHSYNIVSYDKYGIINAVIDKNSDNEFTFTEKEISSIPQEKFISTVIHDPNNFSQISTYIFLNWSLNKNHKMRLTSAYGNSNNFKIPFIPISGLKITAEVLAYSQLDYSRTEKTADITGEVNYIDINVASRLLLPENNAENISDTSNFVVSDNGKPGVYEFHFINKDYEQVIYTSKNKLDIYDMLYYGFHLLGGENYRWYVRKLTGYNSIDEFLKKPFVEDTICSSVETTASFNFTVIH